ncbi:MAG: hypothetical protein M0D53_09365 [Flavobacterium sp. JAD_PAG50586_2]|nr:MAG: hypothetical protein M0D53_09365 [Flavobacterium sp. JAD_PAG50586_2]
MKAETAFNVFQALSPEEQQRMLSMINISTEPKKKAVKQNDDAQVKDMILSKFRLWNIKRKGIGNP